MLKVPVERRDAQGKFVYPRRLRSGSQSPEAVALLHAYSGRATRWFCIRLRKLVSAQIWRDS